VSFESRELSEYSGQPIVMVHILAGGTAYTYTPNDIEATHLSLTYTRLPGLEIGNIEQGMDDVQNEIKITVPRDNPVAQLFSGILPVVSPEVTIYARHFGDSETISTWQGQIAAVDFRGNVAELRCASLLSLLKATGLRYTFSRRCQHQLYAVDTCKVNPASYSAAGTVASITGNVINVAVASAQADTYYSAGMVKRTSTNEIRFITGHTGANLTLYAPFDGLAVSEAVQIFAGCDHTLHTCASKFSNSVNCGCWPAVPLRNPVTNKIVG
jgi:uncharacterized phage protein (TIGR02218 family)